MRSPSHAESDDLNTNLFPPEPTQTLSPHTPIAGAEVDDALGVKESGRWSIKITPTLVLIIAVVLWVIWVLAKDTIFQPTPTAQGMNSIQTVTMPNAHPVTSPLAVGNHEAFAAALATPPVTEVDELDIAGVATGPDTGMAAVEAKPSRHTDRPTLREIELQEKVNELQKKLADQVESKSDAKLMQLHIDLAVMGERIAQLEAKLTGMQVKAEPVAAPPAPKPSKASATPVRKAHVSTVNAAARNQSAVAGFRLNTVFADQAWVDHGDRTYILQVGDRLGAAFVTRIDAKERRVYTNVGVIK